LTPETLQRKQRAFARERSKGRCEAEELVQHLVSFEPLKYVPTWNRCPNRGQFAAHIYQRRACGSARDVPPVVIFACWKHNADHLHDGRHNVRAPLAIAQAAWDAIMGTKRDEQHGREIYASIGPRPEKGAPPYGSPSQP
jgi:hypothetical protein